MARGARVRFSLRAVIFVACSARIGLSATAAAAAGANLEIVDVPNGRHSFDQLDHTDESRAAVQQAMTLVINALS